jgi:DNA-binding response OmpR family regulator
LKTKQLYLFCCAIAWKLKGTRSLKDGEHGLALALAEPFNLVILDIRLPGKDGFDVCRELRRHSISVPVLMLTARSDVADRVKGLKLGADDYLSKPFEVEEFLARIEALLDE